MLCGCTWMIGLWPLVARGEGKWELEPEKKKCMGQLFGPLASLRRFCEIRGPVGASFWQSLRGWDVLGAGALLDMVSGSRREIVCISGADCRSFSRAAPLRPPFGPVLPLLACRTYFTKHLFYIVLSLFSALCCQHRTRERNRYRTGISRKKKSTMAASAALSQALAGGVLAQLAELSRKANAMAEAQESSANALGDIANIKNERKFLRWFCG